MTRLSKANAVREASTSSRSLRATPTPMDEPRRAGFIMNG